MKSGTVMFSELGADWRARKSLKVTMTLEDFEKLASISRKRSNYLKSVAKKEMAILRKYFSVL